MYTARQLHKDGWEVSIADWNAVSGKAAAEEVNGIFTQVDVTNYVSQAKAFENTWEKYGRIDFGQYLPVVDLPLTFLWCRLTISFD